MEVHFPSPRACSPTRRSSTRGAGVAPRQEAPSPLGYCYAVWLRHLIVLDRYGFSGKDAAIGELGPGDSIGTGIAALLSGARRYVGLDAVPYAKGDLRPYSINSPTCTPSERRFRIMRNSPASGRGSPTTISHRDLSIAQDSISGCTGSGTRPRA